MRLKLDENLGERGAESGNINGLGMTRLRYCVKLEKR